MATSKSKISSEEFNQLRLRLFVGVVAVLLPILTFGLAGTPLSSISASYYTNARDIFVGLLFALGVLLWAYDGRASTPSNAAKESGIRSIVRKILRVERKGEQGLVTTLGGITAIAAALCPTACNTCETNPISIIHYVSAFVLFSTTVYFCLAIFRDHAKAKAEENEQNGRLGTKQRIRARIYLACGLGIMACILAAGGAQLFGGPVAEGAWGITYWAEFVALWVFGFAWMAASRILPWFADPDEKLNPLRPPPQEQAAQASA